MAIIAPLTPDETARLEALAAYDVLDTPHEPVFQAITALAAAITGSPIALISLVDKDRQWFKANWGLDVRETPRDIAFCSHAIHQSELFEVSDAFTDKRFFDNPLVQGHAVPDFDEANSVLGIYVMMQDATGLKHAQAALVQLARFDSLTTLANRASLYEILNAALARRSRSGNTLAVLYLDLDKLKAINDRFGHAGGDTVLREFARRLKISIRQTDTAARIAGDEFVVVLEGLHSPDDADAVARTILRNTEGPILIGDQPLHITTSIGIAFGDVTDDAESLLRHADEALYQEKAAGRNVFKRAPQH